MKKRFIIGAIVIFSIAVFGIPPFTGDERASLPMLSKGYAYESGIKRLPNGIYQVRALTPMPGVKPEMVKWWFANYMQTPEHYQRWFPGAHIWMDWENKVPGEIVGASHLVHEYIGEDFQKLRIQFVVPQAIFGENTEIPEGTVALCAYAGLLDMPVQGAELCHVVLETENGVEMRSQFWMGSVSAHEGNERVPSIEGLLGNTYLVRKMALSASQANDLKEHALAEMGILASFLPALYAAEKNSVTTHIDNLKNSENGDMTNAINQ